MKKFLTLGILASINLFYLYSFKTVHCAQEPNPAEKALNTLVEQDSLEELQEKLIEYSNSRPSWFANWLSDATYNCNTNVVLLYYSIRWYKNMAKTNGLEEAQINKLFNYLLSFICILFHDSYVCSQRATKIYNSNDNYNFLAKKLWTWINAKNEKVANYTQNPRYFTTAVDHINQMYQNTIARFTQKMDLSTSYIFTHMTSPAWASSSYYPCRLGDTFYFKTPSPEFKRKIKGEFLDLNENLLRCEAILKMKTFLKLLCAKFQSDGIKLWENLLTTNFELIVKIPTE